MKWRHGVCSKDRDGMGVRGYGYWARPSVWVPLLSTMQPTSASFVLLCMRTTRLLHLHKNSQLLSLEVYGLRVLSTFARLFPVSGQFWGAF